MKKIKLDAYGKINLGLDVLGKRDDGYHDLDMIMQSVDLCDKITITKNDSGEITVKSNTGKIPNDESNLAYKAAKLLKDEFDIEKGVDIEIEKNIPISGGMAGGSTDCAAVLKGMNKLFKLKLSEQDLMDRGVTLGADVPFCIMGKTARAEGIGEVLTPIPNKIKGYIVLAKPPISVSTGFVYGRIDEVDVKNKPDTEAMIDAIKKNDLKGLADTICNVLEEVTIPDYSVVQEIKDKMMANGALNAMMTGSGPTVFGLFDDKKKAIAAVDALKESRVLEQLYLVKFVN
ncbi:MAG: 4-(cytidine 5'-diphospho)-2-C-methyl-D-erythritol kinase [Eubacterium sp.]|nr:4-(cytidine 5'-diphospho)-2-C-methyl-D-erythritol kinase [Eubacterium sp.]